MRLEPGEVAISNWLNEHIVAFDDRAKSGGVDLRGSTEIGSGWFDPVQLGRALDNLITNALQHTSAGGRIDISICRADNMLRISVTDTGSGIPESVRNNLFEPFVSDRADGTGLGLAMAREITEAHGGSIRLVPSKIGATFELDIPWRAS